MRAIFSRARLPPVVRQQAAGVRSGVDGQLQMLPARYVARASILGLSFAAAAAIVGDKARTDGFFDDAKEKINGVFSKFTEPSRESFLPAPHPNLAHLPTLVLDLDETLIHSTWDRKHGWRTIKRPYVDKFLNEMAKSYELVLFSAGLPYVVDPVVAALDPTGLFMFRLYRDCTTYRAGKHIKDLSRLNRDLTKVVMIDDDEEYTQDQPENSIIVTRWEGDRDDRELLNLIPFLKGLAKNNGADFREEIEKYRQGGTTADLLHRYSTDLIEDLKKEQAKKEKMKNLPGGRLFAGAGTGKSSAVVEEQRKIAEMQKMGGRPF